MRVFLRSCILFALFSIAAFAQTFSPIRPGVEYAEMTVTKGDEPISIRILRLDLKKVRLDVVHAFDKAVGLETTSAIAARKGAVAAINAGFFRLDRSEFAGEAAGVLKIDGRLLSESHADRAAIGIFNGNKRTKVVFGRLNAYGAIGWESNISRRFDGINRERKTNDEIILYSPEIGKTPATEAEFVEMIFSECRYGCRKVQVAPSKGGTSIGPDSFVVSLPRNKDTEFFIDYMTERSASELDRTASVFDVLRSPESEKNKLFEKAEDVVGGVPVLIADGKIAIDWEAEKSSKAFAETRHPRTAVALLKNGKFVMVTVDGRQPGYSVGMTLKELADFLVEMGAKDAMNLDGGGSTTMWLGGKVVNKPSDKEGERKVSDALLVFPRSK